MKNNKSANDKNKANKAGTMNQSPTFVLAQTAKMAPINGPTIKPKENAMPTNA